MKSTYYRHPRVTAVETGRKEERFVAAKNTRERAGKTDWSTMGYM
jgi:hypothetical protein